MTQLTSDNKLQALRDIIPHTVNKTLSRDALRLQRRKLFTDLLHIHALSYGHIDVSEIQ